MQFSHYCRCRKNPPVDLPLHSPLTCKQDPEVLEILDLGQNLLPGKALQPFLTENHGLRFGGHFLQTDPTRVGSYGLMKLTGLETSPTYCKECGPSSDTRHTGSRRLVPEDLAPHTPREAHINKHPCTLKDPAEGIALVHSSTSSMKTVLFLPNPRFDYPAYPPLENPLNRPNQGG